MLDIAGGKLMGGSTQKMPARNVVLGDCKRHAILKLIAKSVRATQLVESSASPHAARERLIEQPPIHEHIHGSIGRRDLHGVEDAVPLTPNFTQDFVKVRGTIELD